MHSINGYVFGNLPGPDDEKGDRVRWYVMGMGTEVDLHTPHWHGNTVLFHGHAHRRRRVAAGDTLVADMKPDDPGTWLYHCHVNDHIIAGMMALYRSTIAQRRVRPTLRPARRRAGRGGELRGSGRDGRRARRGTCAGRGSLSSSTAPAATTASRRRRASST